MTGERWKRIEQVFESALELAAEERSAFLDRACDGDPELRREVEAMIATTKDFGGVIQSAIAKEAIDLADSGDALLGKRIGAWRLARVLGHGGMGTVFLAARDDQAFHKKAAIKLIKRGMETAQVLKRFQRERQILARLDHPYIARLLDGGSTEDGAPYFVMEYVDGTPITEYCARHGLRVPDRLRLFLNVCAGVQFAHQNLVVHRDLKPGNIFITRDGTPKLLDFGLAKLMLSDLESEQTLTAMRVMTPSYASPEQVRGEPVTTATDVYSLGVVLYELLTGRRPFDTKTTSLPELERKICHTEPDSPAMIVPALRGDLENILLKALRKEPVRRYASAEQFAEDIRRHLAGLPVLARKDTLAYRTGKFLRRNRWPVAVGAVAVAGLMLTTAIAVSHARRAKRQFEAARSMAMTMLIDVNDEFRLLPGSVKGRKLVVEKGLENLGPLGQEARNDPAVLWDLARGYEKIASLQASPDPAEPNLGDVQNGLRNYQQALSLIEAVERSRGRSQESLLLLCRVHVGIGGINPDPAQANHHLNEALRLTESLGPTGKRWEPDGAELGSYLRDQAFLFLGRRLLDSDPAGALDHFRKTGPQFRGLFSGIALLRLGDLEAGIISLRSGRAGDVPAWSPRKGDSGVPVDDVLRRAHRIGRAASLFHQASALGSPFRMNLGDSAEAVSSCRKALALIEENLARDAADPNMLIYRYRTLSTLGAVLADSSPTKSVSAYSEVISAKLYQGSREPMIKEAGWQISYPLRRLGKRHEALQHAQQSAIELLNANAYKAVADALLDLGRRDAALEHYRKAVAAAEKAAAAAPRNMVPRAELAGVYEAHGKYYELAKEWRPAGEWYAKAHGLWRDWAKSGGVSNPFVVRSERRMGQAVARCGAASAPRGN